MPKKKRFAITAKHLSPGSKDKKTLLAYKLCSVDTGTSPPRAVQGTTTRQRAGRYTIFKHSTA